MNEMGGAVLASLSLLENHDNYFVGDTNVF